MLSKIRINPKLIPFVLLGLCWLSYSIYIHRLGFYWDDWPSIWFYHNLGPESYLTGFAEDRPLLAWIFIFTTSILGESTFAWQFFAMLTRWLTVLAFWWTLRLLWPRHTVQVTWAAFLFAVYPGFRQHYISVTYSNAFLVYAIFLFSFAAMILAHRTKRWFWPLMVLSLFCSAFSIFISEYFFGLELLRPAILWLLYREDKRRESKGLAWVGLRWSPYLATMIIFLIWRLFLHQTPRGQVTIFDQLARNPLWALFDLVKTVLFDLVQVSAIAWVRTLDIIEIFDFDPPVIIIYFGVILSAGILSFFLLGGLPNQSTHEKDHPIPSRSWAKQASLLGLYALVVAGWPFWVTNLHIDLFFPWDRFTMPLMVGVSLLIAGLIDFLSKQRFLAIAVASILVGLAAGMHFYDTMAYRQEWLSQKYFFWQLTWRAPAIEPGTTLLTSELPFVYYSDNSLTAPLNWTFAPQNTSQEMSYILTDMEAQLGYDQLPSLDPGSPVLEQYRATTFQGTTSQALVLFYDPPRCLKVMDPVYDLNFPYKPLYIREALELSNPDLIQTEGKQPAQPPAHIFGPEPDPNWCYYFEKAELAAQTGNWEQVVELAAPAFKTKNSFSRKTAPELVPFIRGYAQTGQWEHAINLSRKAYNSGDKMQYLMCSVWYYIEQDTQVSPAQATAIQTMNQEFDCSSVK